MKSNRSEKSTLYFISKITNAYLFLSVILFIIYLSAPFIGGKFFSRALVIYGSWIGTALVVKYYLSKIQKKIPLKWYEFLFLLIYIIICIVLWFPYPYNILFSILVAFLNVFGYRAQLKSWEKEPKKNGTVP